MLVFGCINTSSVVTGRAVAVFLVAKVGEKTASWSDGRMVHPWLDNTLKLGTIPQFTLNKQLKRRPKPLCKRRCNYHFCYELHASQREETQGKAPICLGLSMEGERSPSVTHTEKEMSYVWVRKTRENYAKRNIK